MSKIASIRAVEILDSRGNPTLQVSVATDRGCVGVAAVPSGASTGEFEACELRDGDLSQYGGKGVKKAIQHIHGPIADLLRGESVFEQRMLDQQMIDADGTVNKSHFGANAILGVSLAVARAAALTMDMPLYRYIGGCNAHVLPCPMMNIINGGVHADNSIDYQEFMIRPVGASSFTEAVRWGAEIFHTLKTLLKKAGYATSVGDEGGFAPDLPSNEAAIEKIIEAIEIAGYQPGKQVTLSLDLAASWLYDSNTHRYIEKKKVLSGKTFQARTKEEQVEYLRVLCATYPIDSIEDGMAEDDWEGWQWLTRALGDRVQLVGDDNFVTNSAFLRKGIKLGVANAILIKVNQIGTLTEAMDCVRLAQANGYPAIISHRSGETEDSFIADLAVGLNAGQMKTGALSRSDRVAKYNRLLTIEAELGSTAVYFEQTTNV